MNEVWIVYKSMPMKDDVLSIWTSEELAKSAVLYYEEKQRRYFEAMGVIPMLVSRYLHKRWQVNTTINQWE